VLRVSGLAELPRDLYHRQTMRRLLALLVLTLVAGGVASCNASFTSYAAKVGDATISQSALHDQLSAIAKDPALRCSFETNGAITGAGGPNTFSASFAASELGAAVVTQVAENELARRGIAVTSLARTLAAQELASNVQQFQSQTCPTSGTSVVAGLPPVLRTSIVDGQAAQDTLAASARGYSLTTAGVATFARAHPIIASNQCVSIIVTSSQTTAQSLRTAIAQGASFASVAKAGSLDTTSAANGGAQGCGPVDGYPAPLNSVVQSLQIGQVSAPVAFAQNGTNYVLLIEVTSRQPSVTTASAELVASGSSAERALINHLISTSGVEVDPAYGTLGKVDGTYTVMTNTGPPAKYLGNLTAITPSVTP
jgi:hypothetical protein